MSITFTLTKFVYKKLRRHKRQISKIVYEAQIDEIDGDLLTLSWHTLVRKGVDTVYIKRGQSTTFMHRVIMERVLGRKLGTKEYVDHIDKNGLNNTRANLRLATPSQNLGNRRASKRNELGVKGVRKHNDKYLARFRNKYLGLFATVDLAREAYMKAARAYYGEFASGE